MVSYFTASESLHDNKKAVRIALKFSGIAQKWFHNIFDIPLDQLMLSELKFELFNTFESPTKTKWLKYSYVT